MIQITVLVDNYAGGQYYAEHGLSYLIEIDNKKWLFDSGQSDLFLQNAHKMNISLADIEGIILSHGHYDHGDGLLHFKNMNDKLLITHPASFLGHYRGVDKSYIGLKLSEKEARANFKLQLSKNEYQLSDSLWFLGEIPRLTAFESKETSFVLEDGSPDFVVDDSGVAMVVDDGIYVLTGCGHAGVVNTVEHAIKVTSISNVKGVLGGFHLKKNNEQTKKTIEYLKDKKVKHIFPSHCNALPAMSAFQQEFVFEEIKVGTKISLK